MKIISPTQHGYRDYVTVALFLVAPTLIGLVGLAMTLVTDFPLGVAKLLPFSIHGWVERVVGPVLILLPFALGFDTVAQGFYVVIGIVIVIVGLLTDYQQTQ
jgi:hypothetical protein